MVARERNVVNLHSVRGIYLKDKARLLREAGLSQDHSYRRGCFQLTLHQ